MNLTKLLYRVANYKLDLKNVKILCIKCNLSDFSYVYSHHKFSPKSKSTPQGLSLENCCLRECDHFIRDSFSFWEAQ